ncbi:alpha-glucosidase C-terminal domain-containing protein, partial [Xanthomonas campestris pv. asclepiadis]|uniref:DUF3459 domain-containing protein n=1 Tax=Xanthomonas campestris TaxID=339 RepID=UPI001E5DC7AF
RWSPWWLVCPGTSNYGWTNFTGSRHKGEPALREGAITFYDTAEPVLMFRREHAGRVMLLAFNLSAHRAELGLPAGAWRQVDVPGVERGAIDHGHLRLAGHAVVCAIAGG